MSGSTITVENSNSLKKKEIPSSFIIGNDTETIRQCKQPDGYQGHNYEDENTHTTSLL